MLRPVCRLHTRQAGRFYALCELYGEELNRSAAPLLVPGCSFLPSRVHPPRLSSDTGGCVHHVADCGGNSRKGPVVGTFGKVAYTQHDR